jgi:hypothetical protein
MNNKFDRMWKAILLPGGTEDSWKASKTRCSLGSVLNPGISNSMQQEFDWIRFGQVL